MRRFVTNDGGRSAAGFKGRANDCVVRAISIAAQLPYAQVYSDLAAWSGGETWRDRRVKQSHPRTGIHRKTYQRYLEYLGFVWTPTMKIGQGCKVHLKREELPSGRLVVALSRHLTAVIDGTIHDTGNPDRGGRRCVYGYYRKPV